MRLLRPLAAAALLLATAAPAFATPATEALSACFTDNTTGRDRKELARWMYIAMAAHPEMNDISSVTADERDQSSRAIGQLITRLLSENCAAQTRTAVLADGSNALKAAFEMLGQLAMTELMANAAVTQSIGGFERYLDKERIQKATAGAGF